MLFLCPVRERIILEICQTVWNNAFQKRINMWVTSLQFHLWLTVSFSSSFSISPLVIVSKNVLKWLLMPAWFPIIISPWYNHTGWLRVKHQLTYLPYYNSSVMYYYDFELLLFFFFSFLLNQIILAVMFTLCSFVFRVVEFTQTY